jgi:hypothetical protein
VALYACFAYNRVVAGDVAVELARHLGVEDHARVRGSVVHNHELVDYVERESAG